MSTDWIKMRVDLRTHPKVVRMSTALKADKLRVIGGLFAVWAIFDAHSEDGFLDGYTFAAIDDELKWKGFAKAMAAIGWLIDGDAQGLSAPRFEEHNGQSAKRRAMETERKRVEREAERLAAEAAKNATKPGQPSADDADKSVTREEKRRIKEKEDADAPTPTPAAAICIALKRAGIPMTNPGHPSLRALLEAGATEDEFIGAAGKAVGMADGFAYVLKVVQSQREKAKDIANGLFKGPLPQSVDARKSEADKIFERGNR